MQRRPTTIVKALDKDEKTITAIGPIITNLQSIFDPIVHLNITQTFLKYFRKTFNSKYRQYATLCSDSCKCVDDS